MSVRMRINRSATGKRRSHHALKEVQLSTCANCGAAHRPHRMCAECGMYRGRQVVDVAAKKEDRAARLAARKGERGEEEQSAE